MQRIDQIRSRLWVTSDPFMKLFSLSGMPEGNVPPTSESPNHTTCSLRFNAGGCFVSPSKSRARQKGPLIIMIDFTQWIAQQRADAKARGGKRWTYTMLAAAKQEAKARISGFYVADRKPGEIVNPITGEVITDCVTIGNLAGSLGTTTARLTGLMEQRGLVHRVLTWKNVPMICHPGHRRPYYYRTPEATPTAIRAGLVAQIAGQWGAGRTGALRLMILATPEGQRLIQSLFSTPTDAPVKAKLIRRDSIERLHRQGRTPSEIVSMTGISRRTVFRHLGEVRKAA